jgi:hypothetical protein
MLAIYIYVYVCVTPPLAYVCLYVLICPIQVERIQLILAQVHEQYVASACTFHLVMSMHDTLSSQVCVAHQRITTVNSLPLDSSAGIRQSVTVTCVDDHK